VVIFAHKFEQKVGESMRITIIAVFLATTAFGFLLQYLNYSRRNAPIPENVKDVYDEETYKKYRAYTMENTKFSIISGLIETAIYLAVLLFNFHHVLYGFISESTSNIYWTSLFIFFVPVIIVGIIEELVGIYSTFGIEAKYGFNKTTPGTYILDFFKSILLMVLIGGGLLMLFLWMYRSIGNWVFLAFFFVLLAFSIFASFLMPLLIRIFYKLTPLEDGELKDKIIAMAEKTDTKLRGIYMVNASKRSTKSNAFAAGFGKTKTIGLFDTLLEKFTHDEILSILAHEIGHEKKKHVIKSFPLSLVSLGIMVLAAFFIVNSLEASQAFGFADVNLAFGVFVLFILIEPINLILSIPAKALSRKHEYEADAYEKELMGRDAPIAAMKKIYREDLGNLTPHPFVVMMEYDHPTASQRIAEFEKE